MRESLPLIGSVLQQLDRDPLSPTYGCFDRQYWHYRTMDFPSGMSQEFVLPVALSWKHAFPGNPYQGQERLREWVLAAIDFARRFSHPDGSCDDYYPFERALGAVVFSLDAMAAAYEIVEGDRPELLAFLVHRGGWVMEHGETGVLSNHHAIAAVALQTVARLTGDGGLEEGARRKVREVLEHQHPEGWFREYDGFDPGYQTVTVDHLARYWRACGTDQDVLPALERAVDLLERVQLPDGLFGGEYSSRNTYHTLPHGLEILAPRVPSARRIADRFLGALARGLRARNDDDRLQGHHLGSYLRAWLDFAPRPDRTPRFAAPGRTYLPACGFLVDRGPHDMLITGLSKGGPFRIYRDDELVANDSGPSLVLDDGSVLVSHLSHDAVVTAGEQRGESQGSFRRVRRERMTPMKSVALRLVMLTVGRFARGLVRRLLQRRLMQADDPEPFRFRRILERCPGGFRVTDEIRREGRGRAVSRILLSVGQTSMYVAASQPWERGWLLPPEERPAEALDLTRDGLARIERVFVTTPLTDADPDS